MFFSRNGVQYSVVLLVLIASLLGQSPSSRGDVVLVPASDPFQITADFLQSIDDEIYGSSIDGNQIQLMIDLYVGRTGCQDAFGEDVCSRCLSQERLLPFLDFMDLNATEGPVMRNVQELGKASLVLIYMGLELGTTTECNSPSNRLNQIVNYEDIVDAVCQYGTEEDTYITQRCKSFTLEQLDWVVEQINATYQPISMYECFTAESLFEDAGIPTKTADRSDLELVFSHLFHHLLEGHCIGESELVPPSFFIDDLFITYSNTDSAIMLEDFTHLLEDIGLHLEHPEEEHAHHDEHHDEHHHDEHHHDVSTTTPSPTFPATTIPTTTVPTFNVTTPASNATENVTALPNNATTVLPTNATFVQPNVTAPSGGSNVTAPSGGSNVTAPSGGSNVTAPGSGVNQTLAPIRWEENRHGRSLDEWTDKHDVTKRDIHLEAEHIGNQCFSAEELFAIFGIDPGVGAGREDFARLCPALIQQLSIKACHEVEREKSPIANVYLWGTLAVLIISLCSLLAVLIIPCSGSCIFNTMMHFLIALAVSTLSGDALFHLLPEALGLHSHGSHDHGAAHSVSLDQDSFTYKLVAVVVSMYVCFLFEKLFRMLSRNTEESESPEFDENVLNGFATEEAMNTSLNNQNGSQTGHKSMDELLMEPLKGEKSSSCFGGFNSSSMIVLLGDTVHNFMDGLAIGVAFTADFYVGVSTSLAIFCHEVPHELGDFAVLLRNGMGKKMALFWNFVSALFAFLGLYVGINLALSDAVHPWIFAVTTGMFLYISLVDLTHTLLEVPPHKFGKPSGKEDNPLDEMDYQRDTSDQAKEGDDCCSSSAVFFFQHFGLFLGWVLMLMLGLYEDKLTHVF